MLQTKEIEALFRTYYRPLCLYALHYLGDPDAVEDVVQESFTALWRQENPVASGKAWLYSAVRNRSIDALNSRMLEMRYFSLTGIPYVDGLLSEDIVPPDNVEGGIGFVTVRSVSRAVCDFGERELPDGDIFNWPLE